MSEDFLPFARPDLDPETIAEVVAVLSSGWITTGPKVAAFEEALTRRLGRPARVFTSATFGLEVALEVAGVGAGDEVLVPAMTFAATANVVLRRGAVPVLVDVLADSRNMDLALAEAAVTPRTRAIMPVHFAGLAVDLDGVHALAKRHGLRVVEDAAHAIGAGWRGRAVGSFGDLAVFSFHPNKNMTSIEGGAVLFPDEEGARVAERLRFHGIEKYPDGRMDVSLPGGKGNLTDVAAAVGLGQLRRLDAFNTRRRQLVALYRQALADTPLELPADLGGGDHAWHLFAPLLPSGADRPGFMAALAAAGIGSGVHYPSLSDFSLYRQWRGRCPVAEDLGRRCATLPLFPAMTEADVARVAAACRAALGG